MGPAIVLSGRNKSDQIWPWILMSLVFVALFLHRMSLVYTLSGETLSVGSWWGLGRPQSLTVSAIDRTDVLRSMAMRLAGCGHVVVHSRHPDEGSITLLAQAEPHALADELSGLGRGDGRGGEEGSAEGDGEKSDGDRPPDVD
jgi:hypothetical protein